MVTGAAAAHLPTRGVQCHPHWAQLPQGALWAAMARALGVTRVARQAAVARTGTSACLRAVRLYVCAERLALDGVSSVMRTLQAHAICTCATLHFTLPCLKCALHLAVMQRPWLQHAIGQGF